MAKFSIQERTKKCALELAKSWKNLRQTTTATTLPEEIRKAVERAINSPKKSYRYVLPTQVLAKVVDPELDCRCIQEGVDSPGSFDARSLCHKVVVPFDRENHNVLGGSPEPYANNPLRIPKLSSDYRANQKDKVGFDQLCLVAEYLESNPKEASAVLTHVLHAIQDRLGSVRIIYPVPNRVSLDQALALIRVFLTERTGGVRLQCTAIALFQTIGARFKLFESVHSSAVNAADASTGNVADLTCSMENGQVVLAVEVKDRQLRFQHIQDKLPAAREQGVRELLFLTTSGIEDSDQRRVAETIKNEFGLGQNLYVVELEPFLRSCLTLFGEEGRRSFLMSVGEALDEANADLSNRQAWRGHLESL